MNNPREILILSGKGGTGKTTVAASLAKLINKKVIADTDVDAADMHIMMNPSLIDEHSFKGRSKAFIEQDKCNQCGLCHSKCKFNAIDKLDNKYIVNSFSCEGCTLCYEVCPTNAIVMEEEEAGKWYLSKTDFGLFVHARLNPGAENSGNLVSMVKHQAKQTAIKNNIDTILIDGPPGIGCPVIASLSGANTVILVTEPTVSGVSDLKRIIGVAQNFKPEIAIVINKFDINTDISKQIDDYANNNKIPIIAHIPFDKCIVELLMEKKTPIESNDCPEINKEIKSILNYLGEKHDN